MKSEEDRLVVSMVWEAGADRALGLPCYQSAGAAGADLCANLPDRGEIRLEPFERALVPTGIMLAIPEGYEAQIRPRSGLALNHGIILPNSPGTIDCDYRGPLGVIVMNAGKGAYCIRHGDRIAQLVVAPVRQARFVQAQDLPATQRASGGFGSTGRRG